MKSKQALTILMFFFCLNIFGQKTDVASKQQETILQLQKENKDLKNKLEEKEREIGTTRDEVKNKVSELDEAMSRWVTILSIIIGITGVIFSIICGFLGYIVPNDLNSKSEERQEKRFSEIKEELDKQIETLTKQAKDDLRTQIDEAIKQAKTELNKQISEAKEQAEIATKKAEEAKEQALDAKASQLLALALNEKDPYMAIKLLNECIKIKPTSFTAYNNRGVEKAKLPDYGPQAAIEDYNTAINLYPK